MDPVTAVGLAAAIAQFVCMGVKVGKRLKEMSEAGNIPEVFRNIQTGLPLLITIVVCTQQQTTNLTCEAMRAFEEVVRRSFEQVDQLNVILGKVKISKGDSRLRKMLKAGISLVEEGRVQRIATFLRDNVQLLTFLNVTPAEKAGGRDRPKVSRLASEPLLSYENATDIPSIPFTRDDHFIGRESDLNSIATCFLKQRRVAVCGIGGVGKSQIAIEYCYRHKANNTNAEILWVYGGNIARFYQGYKRIAQLMEIPGWDDPEASILELVRSWLSSTRMPYLLVIDNADNIEHWWPGKYKPGGPLDDPSDNLSKFLPNGLKNSQLLITTRDYRVASRLASEGKPINLAPMSNHEARALFLSRQAGEKHNFNEAEISNIVEELDHLPLAISQAAAFIQEHPISIAEYTAALRGKNAKEFLNEELNDSRRDEESDNSVFRTWSVSFDQIKQQKPCAADLLSLMAMLDRQSVPQRLLKMPEVTTSLGTLQAFGLVTTRAGSQSFQIHRLVQSFVQTSLQMDGTTQKWQEAALACVSKEYPTEIGVAEWPLCDALAPQVHVLTGYSYRTAEAQLDLAHLLCWAADFDIERGMYVQALDRAGRSLDIFQKLISEHDERHAAATWLYGRLRYYQVQSARDIKVATDLLQKALDTSKYPSLTYAETAFELAHLYYDQCNGEKCLEMGKASFQCWETMEGVNSSRTLDNMHDYALELAMLGHKEEGIAKWQEIIKRSPTSDASEQTKTVYSFRSLAGIAEFQGDAAMAEIFYAKLIAISEATYHSEHIHLFDYRLSHAEQIIRQGRLEEATGLSEAILTNYKDSSEWRVSANCLQLIAECCRLKASYSTEHAHRVKVWEMHEKKLGRHHRETMNAAEALADCYLNSCKYLEAENTYKQVLSWRNDNLGLRHPDTVRAIECIGIFYAGRQRHAEAEALYLDAIDRQGNPDSRLIDNLCQCLWRQGKWATLETWARQNCDSDDDALQASAFRNLTSALEHQGKGDEVLEVRAMALALETLVDERLKEGDRTPTKPPARDNRRFGRMIHPRTWSA